MVGDRIFECKEMRVVKFAVDPDYTGVRERRCATKVPYTVIVLTTMEPEILITG